MSRFIPNTPNDRQRMLDTLNLKSTEDLFNAIPESIRLKGHLNLNSGISELELLSHMKALAYKNRGTEELTCFLGAGAYDRYIPSVIDHLISRSEFYTAYTPYQPEISQGTLQAIFEFQTMIANLTGMEVANASMYDGASACGEAALMAADASKRRQVLVSKTVHPEVREVLSSYVRFNGMELLEIDSKYGVTDKEKLNSLLSADTAAVVLQNPNFFGIIEDFEAIEQPIHNNKSLMIVNVSNPLSLSLIKSPGEIKADIVVGEGQSFGVNLSFGGPYLGFMATTSKLMRKLPGRIVGQTTDIEGKRAFVLTLQAREQHIRREKATSNICSNQSLNALCATIYLSYMGKCGFKEAAQQSMKKAHYLHGKLKAAGFNLIFEKPFFNEFAVSLNKDPIAVNERLLKEGILGGYVLGEKELGNEYKGKSGLLICVTEKRTKDEIDKLVSILYKEGK
ncbi:putative glycine dehydrogenase (decarboxylating) subunit 1 [Oxobacter pfennigii]|uniref:Probable glycine dehydrogenase (decarboxylating) subunit 1 n=1 Tax=Oxobacter pfennigii TaxID=36849 RepID=A0A0P8Z1I4_9CLOT|nr:aminomethyl-transferring glycine dehydrogenase subunit GcvPA [Oxobacter pfennigii]KPU45971.1 putative glycine dehydrogenase (decarboxylating) subunit 1 [Oxobacter pfennigii]